VPFPEEVITLTDSIGKVRELSYTLPRILYWAWADEAVSSSKLMMDIYMKRFILQKLFQWF
jgi:hypothetical protein